MFALRILEKNHYWLEYRYTSKVRYLDGIKDEGQASWLVGRICEKWKSDFA